MRITHVVVTAAFAGTERYVCEVARRQAARGHDVRVVGGSADRMPLELGEVGWRSGATVAASARQVAGQGRRDVVHTHLSAADVVGALTRPVTRALHVSTRHIAGRRGRSLLGSLSVPLVERAVDVEIAISRYVAAALERPPDLVLPNGVAVSNRPYDATARTVLVLQRLEPEKGTAIALAAWGRSGLAADGWDLLVAGSGSERTRLERQAPPATRFLGQVDDVAALLGRTALLLAAAPGEPLGLSVLEAMAAGVPVVAAAAGGHLETLPPGWHWTFPPGDVDAAARALRSAATDLDARRRGSDVVRAHQREHFDVEQHTDALLAAYERAASRRGPQANT